MIPRRAFLAVPAWVIGRQIARPPGAVARLPEIEILSGATDDTVVYGGRGDRTSLANAVPAQMTYLTAMETLVSGYVHDLGSRRSELTDPTLAPAHYKQLATLGSQAFPSYALPYLIEYGVYGLVNAIAFP